MNVYYYCIAENFLWGPIFAVLVDDRLWKLNPQISSIVWYIMECVHISAKIQSHKIFPLYTVHAFIKEGERFDSCKRPWTAVGNLVYFDQLISATILVYIVPRPSPSFSMQHCTLTQTSPYSVCNIENVGGTCMETSYTTVSITFRRLYN